MTTKRDTSPLFVVGGHGTVNAQALAVGPNARAVIKNAAPGLAAAGRDDLIGKLDAVMVAIETHGAQLPDKPVASQLVEHIATEAARTEPDKITLRSFLTTLAEEVKSVSVIAGAVTALAAAIGAMI